MVHRKWDGLGRYLLGSGATWLLPLVAEAPWERLQSVVGYHGPEVLQTLQSISCRIWGKGTSTDYLVQSSTFTGFDAKGNIFLNFYINHWKTKLSLPKFRALFLQSCV